MGDRERRTGFLPGAVRLAREMRAGSSAHGRGEGGPPGPFDRDADVRRYLEPYSNTLGHVPRAGSKPLARLTWFARRVWKKLLAPWLSMQTQFNEATIAVVEQLMTALRKERARRLHLEERVRGLEESRVRVDRPAEPSSATGNLAAPTIWEEDQNGVAGATLTEQDVENIFLYTRLPPPPARVLAVVDGAAENVLKLSSLGFEVVSLDVRTLTDASPTAALPFDDASFDVAVSLSIIAAEGPARGDEIWSPDEPICQEICRVLRPGGRFICTAHLASPTKSPVPRGVGTPIPNPPAARLRVRERVCATRAGDGWRFSPDEGRTEETEGAARVGAVHLVSAEKL